VSAEKPVAGAVPALALAHLGAPGSFSEEAAQLWAARAGLVLEPRGCGSFEAVLAELALGRAGLAILPLANSSAGLVRPALAALLDGSFELVDELALVVRLSLWAAHPEVRREQVERVASHPWALLQCRRYLACELPGRSLLEWSDTGAAARDLAAGRLDEHTLVLASERAGALHGLARVAADVQDEPRNRTFFALLKRRAP
jgi:prephenate dehydratase